MNIYLIRHGETTANEEQKFAGIWDVNLTREGVNQAVLAGEKLKNIKFDKIYCSDLIRAHETAKLIAVHQQVNPIALSSLQEMNFGNWEHKKISEIKAYESDLLNKWFVDFENFSAPQGESSKEMFQRVIGAYKNIIKPYTLDSDAKIAIVAHGGVIQTLLSYLCYGDSTGYWKFKVDNCGINRIKYLMGYPVIHAINQ